jgi:hypothetical protein
MRTTKLRVKAGVALAVAATLLAATPAWAAIPSQKPDKTASVNGRVRVVAYNSTGTVLYVAGEFTSATDGGVVSTRNNVAAIDTTTGHLLPWNPNANNHVEAMAIDPATGDIFLGGIFTKVGGVARTRLARVSGTGTGALVTSFNHTADNTVRAMSIANARVYIGGTFTSVDGAARGELAAIGIGTTAGTLDTSWHPQAVGGTIRDMVANATRVYVGGEETTLNGAASLRYLGAVNPTTGANDSTFKPSVAYRVLKIAVTADAVYAAADGTGGHLRAISLAGKDLWTATSDGGFQAVTVMDGIVYAGGHFDYVCSTAVVVAHTGCVDGKVQRRKLAAFDLTGTLQAWAPQANSALGVFTVAQYEPSGRIAVGGDFTGMQWGQIPQAHVAQFS